MNAISYGWRIAVMATACVLFPASKTTGPYIDGDYNGISRAMYSEEYYGNTRITINNGWITRIVFFVRDSAKHELFDAGYERYFKGNDLYVQQCRNDWKGINSYPDSLMKHQDIRKVDAMSGATWSYNLFKCAVKEAMTNARQNNE
jgi:major membrane immunogen (membrane-anchored lipoprotein)